MPLGTHTGLERRRSGDTWLEGMPMWVKATVAVSRAVVTLGVSSAIAIFLVWMLASDLPRLSREVAANTARLDQLQRALEDQKVRQDATFRLLQRICANTAKTETAGQRCFD